MVRDANAHLKVRLLLDKAQLRVASKCYAKKIGSYFGNITSWTRKPRTSATRMKPLATCSSRDVLSAASWVSDLMELRHWLIEVAIGMVFFRHRYLKFLIKTDGYPLFYRSPLNWPQFCRTIRIFFRCKLNDRVINRAFHDSNLGYTEIAPWSTSDS
jgi:hypothetical protein